MMNFASELRYAFRSLRKSPGFSLVAGLMLALGIGATAAMFSVVNAVVLQPMPFDDADQLAVLWDTKEGHRWPGSVGNFSDVREQGELFDGASVVDMLSFNLTGSEVPVRVPGAKVSADFFSLLRVPAARGRVFTEQEEQAGQDKVVVLAHDFWRQHLAGDESALGEVLSLDGTPYTVVGIMPPGFEFPYLGDPHHLWVPRPISAEEKTESGRSRRNVAVVARLRDGVSGQQAETHLESLYNRLAQEYPVANTGWQVDVVSLYKQTVKDSSRTLLFLLGAVGLLLLVALANVTNLVLARHTSRQREVALRTALGAGRLRLARQLVLETTLLALIAGVVGVALAQVGTRLLLRLNPGTIPRLSEVGVDLRVLLFALGISLLLGVILGVAPALRIFSKNAYDVLKEGGGKSTSGRKSQWLRSGLLTGESALVLLLLVVSGVVLQGFQRLVQVNPGFQVADRGALQIVLPKAQYPEGHQIKAFFDQVTERLELLPGVKSAGAASSIPLVPSGALTMGFVIEGSEVDLAKVPTAGYDLVTEDFFKTLGTPVVRGRSFDSRDREDSLPVMVINESMAERFWPGEDPLGKRVQIFDPSAPWFEIIGVVGDVHHQGLDSDARPALYQPLSQAVLAWHAMEVVVWTEPGRLQALLPALRQAVWEVDSNQAVDLRTLEQVAAESVVRQRFTLRLLALFALVALVLGALGIYGVVSYSVSQQKKEAGLRMALGAQRKDILRWVLIKGMTPVLLGIVLGAILASVNSSLLASLVFEVNPSDPVTIGAISILLALVALAAAFVPARRATHVDPMTTLRED
ncbi:MAG: ABC transporter permease [Deltaproteobacteria bacterium]|nr:ABC transporter permease [Deltaproteobacteria bacterium]